MDMLRQILELPGVVDMSFPFFKLLQVYREKSGCISGEPAPFFQFISTDDFPSLMFPLILFGVLNVVLCLCFRISVSCLLVSHDLLIF